MKPQDQIKALAELDGWEQGKENPSWWQGIDATSNQRIFRHETEFTYLTSYDAIIPLIQKQPLEISDRIATKGGPISFMVTSAQLAEKLLRATGKWKE